MKRRICGNFEAFGVVFKVNLYFFFSGRSGSQGLTASATGARTRTVPPKFYSAPHNKVAELGETIRFQCSIGGQPAPRVTWDKDNFPIRADQLDDRFHFEERNETRTLEIRNIEPQVGLGQCRWIGEQWTP